MKKAEIILGVIALVALALNLFLISGSGVMIVLSLSAVAAFYMYLSFALFNNVPRRAIFKKDSYKGISTMRIAGAALTGIALAVAIVGLLFKIQSWPGATMNLKMGVIGLAIAFVVGAIRYFQTKSDFYLRVFKRIAVFGGLGLILLLLPPDTWIEIKYRNHPDYLQAFKESLADPNNEELRTKLDEERQKMNERK